MRVPSALPSSLLVLSLSLFAAGRARGADEPANPAPTGAAIPSDVKGAPPAPAEKKASPPFTIYGRVNVSFDVGSQGLNGLTCMNPNSCTATDFTGRGSIGPQGNLRWLPDLASNLSRFGVRGGHALTDTIQAVFQIEAEVAMTATPGVKNNGNNDTINPGNNAINGALASRNSFVGISTPYGALKAGKSDTPYKSVTADFDFLGETVGDYNSIMGNTGGDNRTEFDARFPHAIWYESPSLSGLHVSAMWSPGQNHFTDNIGFATGETVCAGGNSGPCNDGSFGDGWSFSADWQGYGLKILGSYELHRATNRTGDSGQTTPTGVSQVGVGDETAWKAGIKYTFAPTGTTIAGIFEDMRRRDALNWNERQRSGFFISALQKVGKNDDLMASFTHAGKTPGDPTIGPIDNQANQIAFEYRHWFDAKTTVYLVYAHLGNEAGAHYALGPGGHGLTWDCKDGSGPGSFADSTGVGIGLEKNGTQCFTGNTPQAVSMGMTYDF